MRTALVGAALAAAVTLGGGRTGIRGRSGLDGARSCRRAGRDAG